MLHLILLYHVGFDFVTVKWIHVTTVSHAVADNKGRGGTSFLLWVEKSLEGNKGLQDESFLILNPDNLNTISFSSKLKTMQNR